MKTYRVNEIFFSLQGEGIRAGTANVFVRFSGCNQTCKMETHGFDCDTEFTSGRDMSADEIVSEIKKHPCRNVILTGGEPGLQIDRELLNALNTASGLFYTAIETNGSIELPDGLDWITVSPKVAEHALRQLRANEVKYVRNVGQGIPKTRVDAEFRLISPACEPDGHISADTLKWCIELVKQNPTWRLSCQQHKTWKIR